MNSFVRPLTSLIFTVSVWSDIFLSSSVALTFTSYELFVPISVGFSKSGDDLKVSAPVEESILNLEASAPPFRDQVTFLSALKVWTEFKFSFTDFELIDEPAPPEGPVILAPSFMSAIETVFWRVDLLPASSVATTVIS